MAADINQSETCFLLKYTPCWTPHASLYPAPPPPAILVSTGTDLLLQLLLALVAVGELALSSPLVVLGVVARVLQLQRQLRRLVLALKHQEPCFTLHERMLGVEGSEGGNVTIRATAISTHLLQLCVEMSLFAQQLFDLALQPVFLVLQLGDVTTQLPLLDVAPTTTRRLANNDRCAIKSLLCIDS